MTRSPHTSNLLNLNRRDFVGLLGLTTCLLPSLSFSGITENYLFSSVRDKHDKHWLRICTVKGEDKWTFPIPSRAHGGAAHPAGYQVVMVGRRPANWLKLVDFSAKEPKIRTIQTVEGRHFYGHAVYSADGSIIYTTENDYDHKKGIIGIYDNVTGTRLGEWESGGIGPHELKLMPNGNQLAIANGGILTHPSQPRKKLNLDSMQPNLSLLDTRTGKITKQFKLENHQLSIRHLDVTSNGTVWIGCQYQGDLLNPIPLVAYLKQDSTLKLAETHTSEWRKMKFYCGSVCSHPNVPYTAISSPRGNHIQIWQSETGKLVNTIELKDVCGLAPLNKGFLASNGKGNLAYIEDPKINKLKILMSNEFSWDNHMFVA